MTPSGPKNWAKRALTTLTWRLDGSLSTRDLDELVRLGRVVIGSMSYGAPKIYVYGHDDTKLLIGNYTSIARGAVFVLGGNHRLDTVTTYPLSIRFGLPTAGRDGQPWSRGDVVVGSDVWIASHAVVLSGIRIGDGAVVAAGSVVTRDVRPFAVVAGNPAREVRRRFTDAQCDALLRIGWWEWDEERVRVAAAELGGDDIDGFIAHHL